MSLWSKTRKELDVLVNDHFDTPEYKEFFSVKLTPERQAIIDLHYPHYIKSRRDCWGAAAVRAPLDVKRAIWEHEKDELIFDKRLGAAHLTDEQMAEATAESNLLPAVRAVFFAWMHLATTRPWIESLMVNHITERKNNPAIVKGGGFTARFAHKKESLPQVAEAHNATLLDAYETGMETPKRTIEVESQCFLELIGGYSLILPPFASVS